MTYTDYLNSRSGSAEFTRITNAKKQLSTSDYKMLYNLLTGIWSAVMIEDLPEALKKNKAIKQTNLYLTKFLNGYRGDK